MKSSPAINVLHNVLPQKIFQVLQTKYPAEELTILAQALVENRTNKTVNQSSVANNVIKHLLGKEMMTKFGLEQNYLNPFNPTTTIRFTIHEPQITTLKVFNILGEEIATLLNNEPRKRETRNTIRCHKLTKRYIYTNSPLVHLVSKQMMLLK